MFVQVSGLCIGLPVEASGIPRLHAFALSRERSPSSAQTAVPSLNRPLHMPLFGHRSVLGMLLSSGAKTVTAQLLMNCSQRRRLIETGAS